MLSEFILFFN